ncbi:hypothetical protein F443_10908 [Plasmopara halstedii]|uniref:Transmembrane protein n=1 Tax=Plasmopara halstedii TaxID=4781 RepID=A0A0P1B5Q8_PLAHL|nr:hypothetical protein F443_10908 [Plasmopara halstedii]CEG50170.1 hypothetical protein F443_10908 [Plasmopara halstedii]|eukprot:XP_024586539.1 hypothetical protein F443_10908 [Plasmopara halstedii]
MGRLHFPVYDDGNAVRTGRANELGSSTDYNQTHNLPSLKRSAFQYNLNQSGFDRSLRVENVLGSVPILGKEDNHLVESVAIMNGAASAVQSPTYRKQLASREEDTSVPFPALTRKFEINLMSREHIGLLVSTGLAGILTTCLKSGVLPLLELELEMKRYQVVAASVLILLPWSYSFLWGFISDAVPIIESRRKAYIILAWMTTMLACFIMALLDQFVEYRAEKNDVTSADLLERTEGLMVLYIILLVLTNFGCIVAIVIAQTYVIAQTRIERLTVRGTALGTLIMTQCTGECIGQVIADYAILQVTDKGMSPTMTLRQMMLFFVFYTILPLIALCVCFFEKPDPPPISFGRNGVTRETSVDLDTTVSELQRAYMTAANSYQRGKLALRGHWIRLRSALGKESTSRVILFFIGFILLSEFSLTYPITRIEDWCGMTAKAISTRNIMTQVFSLLSVLMWRYFFLNCDWRWYVFISFIIVTMTPQFVYYLMATLEVEARNLDIYAVVSGLTGFIRSSIRVLELAITAEIAPVGGEGAFVGIVVSMASSMGLLANTVSNAIGFMFEDVHTASNSRTDPDRMQVAFALVLSYIIQIIGLVALVFLPKQKRELQRLHRFGNKNDKCTTWWVIGCLAVSFIVSTVFNILAIAPSTSCMRIVGGNGC